MACRYLQSSLGTEQEVWRAQGIWRAAICSPVVAQSRQNVMCDNPLAVASRRARRPRVRARRERMQTCHLSVTNMRAMC